jgi:uncharacterized protein (TIGR03083 family)
MDLSSMEPRDVRPQLRQERADLLELLAGLTADQWTAPTAALGWSVKDVALHLLDDDLGWLSRGRDGDRSGHLDMSDHEAFVRSLAAKNQRWVDGAQGLSRDVVVGLLTWAGEQMDTYYAAMDLTARGHVAWAGGDVPVWFDIEQDLTERWVHQQQIRTAVGIDDGYSDRYLPVVLATFVWAFPAQYAPPALPGTEVGLDFEVGPGWTLTWAATSWSLGEGFPGAPAASLRCDAETAWLLLTGALSASAHGPELRGPRDLTEPLLTVRGILV